VGNNLRDSRNKGGSKSKRNPVPPPDTAPDSGMRTDLDEVGSQYPTSKTVPPQMDSGMRALHPIIHEDDTQAPSDVPRVELETPPPEAMQGAPSLNSDAMEVNDSWGSSDQSYSRREFEQGSIFQSLGEFVRQIVAIVLGNKGG